MTALFVLNRPVAQIPQCTSSISNNAPFCNRNVYMCAHFCYKMVHCGICELGLLMFCQSQYGIFFNSWSVVSQLSYVRVSWLKSRLLINNWLVYCLSYLEASSLEASNHWALIQLSIKTPGNLAFDIPIFRSFKLQSIMPPFSVSLPHPQHKYAAQAWSSIFYWHLGMATLGGHDMETFSKLLALCEGNAPVTHVMVCKANIWVSDKAINMTAFIRFIPLVCVFSKFQKIIPHYSVEDISIKQLVFQDISISVQEFPLSL